ncbi:MAG: tyrosine-type recombinase/integrase, partial [Thermoanaerobaculia bacterium]
AGRRIWMLDYYAPSPVDGKMIRLRESSGTENEKAARNMLRNKVADCNVASRKETDVETPAHRRVTVAEVLDDYLRKLRLEEAKGVRNEEYRLGKDSPLRRELGFQEAAALTARGLEKYAEARRKSGRSNATINRDLEGLRAALRHAAKGGRVLRLPVFPEKLRERVRQGWYTAEEIEKLCSSSPWWLAEMIRFAFATGWRRGELLGLRWDWVDREAREVRIPDSKSGEGRVVPIAGELVGIMERAWERRRILRRDGTIAMAESEWVFHDAGRAITRKRFVRAWKGARKAAGLEERLFHDLRRSGARRLINAGVPQSVAMKILGHETPSMFRRYNIVETSDQARALEQVAKVSDGHRNGHR